MIRMSWYPDSDPSPALRNIQWRHGLEDFGPGDWPEVHEFYECCVGYQSNCLLLSDEFGEAPELEVRGELTDAPPMEEALAVVDCFAQRLGRPVKQCVRAVFPWEMREEIAGKPAYLRPRFASWSRSHMVGLMTLYYQAKKHRPPSL